MENSEIAREEIVSALKNLLSQYESLKNGQGDISRHAVNPTLAIEPPFTDAEIRLIRRMIKDIKLIIGLAEFWSGATTLGRLAKALARFMIGLGVLLSAWIAVRGAVSIWWADWWHK